MVVVDSVVGAGVTLLDSVVNCVVVVVSLGVEAEEVDVVVGGGVGGAVGGSVGGVVGVSVVAVGVAVDGVVLVGGVNVGVVITVDSVSSAGKLFVNTCEVCVVDCVDGVFISIMIDFRDKIIFLFHWKINFDCSSDRWLYFGVNNCEFDGTPWSKFILTQ